MRRGGFPPLCPLITLFYICRGRIEVSWTFKYAFIDTFKQSLVWLVTLITTSWASFTRSLSCLGYTWHIFISCNFGSHFYVYLLSIGIFPCLGVRHLGNLNWDSETIITIWRVITSWDAVPNHSSPELIWSFLELSRTFRSLELPFARLFVDE